MLGATKGVTLVITRKDSPASSTMLPSIQEQHTILTQLRHQLHLQYRPLLQQGAGPIRVMARMVTELTRQCRELHISEDVIQQEIVNRTIGDIDLRQITECIGEPGGPDDYRMLADELGIALPDEQLHDYTATGETYLWLRDQVMDCERLLLEQRFDPRIYDILGVGNPVLRNWLAEEMQSWGLSISGEQIFLSLGAMDGIDKTLRGLCQVYREEGINDLAVLFPAPGFGVPEWQARSYGYRLQRIPTLPENHFKLTPEQLDQALQQFPDIRIIYLTVTNNPTAFAFSPDELRSIYEVLRTCWQNGREVLILADLAYVGTGKPEEDRTRMATFAADDILQHTLFVSSFSKTHSLTGERLGWVTVANPTLASGITCGWTNSMASLPAEWQLRFMAYLRLIRSRPWLGEKLRRFYHLRRRRFIEQLRQIDSQLHLFEKIYIDDDATVYNWSRLQPGEDAFTLFEKTGIAGVPGSGFGYTDDYVRFSIGVIPVPETTIA